MSTDFGTLSPGDLVRRSGSSWVACCHPGEHQDRLGCFGPLVGDQSAT